MKIMLFRGGKPGVVTDQPWKNIEVESAGEELSNLLGGAVEMTQMNARMLLVTLKESETAKRPVQYAIHGLQNESQNVAGDIAVVAVRPEGILRDVTKLEITAANACIQPLYQLGQANAHLIYKEAANTNDP